MQQQQQHTSTNKNNKHNPKRNQQQHTSSKTILDARKKEQVENIMTSIVELFPKCGKLAYDARQQLSQLQRLQQQKDNGSSSRSSNMSSDLYIVLDELDRQLDMMEELVLKEIPSQREKWKRKIAECRQESTQLRQQGQRTDEYYRRHYQQTARYGSDRDELLSLRRRGGGRNANNNNNDMDHLASESQSLEQSNLMVHGLLENGQASLLGLQEQRKQLRSVRGVMNEIGNRLGLTQSTMRIIERRDITDAYLVAAGMVVTCLVIYFVWF